MAAGTTIEGTTCGGMQVGDSPCQEPGHPDVFIYVDAPAGAALHLTSSYGVSLLSFPTCESTVTSVCDFASPQADGGTLDTGDPSVRLIGLERVDTFCGAFTISVTAE